MCSAIIRDRLPGATLLEAGNGLEAQSVAAGQEPDLAVLDMTMPGMSGLELAELLKASHPRTRLALLTANVQDAVQQRAAGQGVRFFRKPITEAVIDDILALLEPAP